MAMPSVLACQIAMLIAMLIAGLLPRTALAQAAGPDSSSPGPLHRGGLHLPFLHHRHRGKRTRRAQGDSTTVLQLEMGYDGNYHAPGLTRDQAGSVSVVFTPTAVLELQADVDAWAEQGAPRQPALHGHGDAHLTSQWTVHHAADPDRAVALAYDIKFPTASGGLGSGRVDHRWFCPVSTAIGRLEVDIQGGVDANGGKGGLHWGVEGAASGTLPLAPRFAAYLGWSGSTVDTDQPAGHYVTGGATWQLTARLAFDVSGRAGLDSGAPDFGVTAGLTTALITR